MRGAMPPLLPKLLSLGALSFVLAHCGEQPAETQASCSDIVQQAGLAWRSDQASADRSCATDGDCTTFDFAIRCIPGCGSETRAVARSAASTLESQRNSREAMYCPQLQSGQCPFDIPSCGAPDIQLDVACLNGRCELCADGECLVIDDG